MVDFAVCGQPYQNPRTSLSLGFPRFRVNNSSSIIVGPFKALISLHAKNSGQVPFRNRRPKALPPVVDEEAPTAGLDSHPVQVLLAILLLYTRGAFTRVRRRSFNHVTPTVFAPTKPSLQSNAEISGRKANCCGLSHLRNQI